jgi:endonuclease/exonuclease/phosphatase family metal-dependent hydrolase
VSRRVRTAGVAAALLALGVVVGVNVGVQDGAMSLFDTGSTAHTSDSPPPRRVDPTPEPPAPQVIVPAVRFNKRILTVPEMKVKFGKQGLHLVESDPTRPTTFTISSFNVLGSSHTGKKGAAAGPARAARAGALVRRKGVSVVGLQEFQSNQRGAFLSNAGMVAYPAEGGLDGENSIAWDPGDWELVEGNLIGIPYFFGKPRQMPYVLLRNLHTNRLAWFTNYHNPADVFGCKCGGHRVAATDKEVALAKELTADGTPMFTTGDMNDRDAYACRYSTSGLHSADGVTRVGGSCRLPGNEWIDWIWGSAQVEFSNYQRDFSPRNGPKISDHPIVTATATIAPAAGECKSYTRHGEKYWFCPDPTAD